MPSRGGQVSCSFPTLESDGGHVGSWPIFVVLALLRVVRLLLKRRADRKAAESSETEKKVNA